MPSSSPAAKTSAQQQAPRTRLRRTRKPTSCTPCRESKLRCDRQYPCATCKRRNLVPSCIYPGASKGSAAFSSPRADIRTPLPQADPPTFSTGASAIPAPRDRDAMDLVNWDIWQDILDEPTQ